jgi:hypothetical protein
LRTTVCCKALHIVRCSSSHPHPISDRGTATAAAAEPATASSSSPTIHPWLPTFYNKNFDKSPMQVRLLMCYKLQWFIQQPLLLVLVILSLIMISKNTFPYVVKLPACA